MPHERLHLAPDQDILELRRALDAQLALVAQSIASGGFSTIFDPQMRHLLGEGFDNSHADEGVVWLVDADHKNLVPVFGTGPLAKHFVGKFKQPLSSGLLSMVFATERPFIENHLDEDVSQNKKLDSLLKVKTHAMVAAPLYFLHGCRGIVSCVQWIQPRSKQAPPGFHPHDMERIQNISTILGRLIEHRTVSTVLGWSRR